ncbi:hypothetical protein K7432_003405 [Basidiobolus ranarum]|uniref:Phosphatidylinositol N-acetylglucosaminyltransferase subunit H conserved domain-containing protein n=1 Tax=Basidiobolus ranarum TaxID=34480 RepID=A0ABR2W6A4_9FUNG
MSSQERYTLRCVVLSDNAREYVMANNKSSFDALDILTLLLFAIISLMVKGNYGWLVSAVLLGIWIKSKLGHIRQESILAVRDVGVQVKTTYLMGRTVSQFIDKSKIGEIIINEGFTMLQVKYYLAIIVEKKKMVVVFEHLLPRLNILLTVYRGTRAIMFNEHEEFSPENHEEENSNH